MSEYEWEVLKVVSFGAVGNLSGGYELVRRKTDSFVCLRMVMVGRNFDFQEIIQIRTEFHMLSKLQHPNIIGHFGSVYYCEEQKLHFYIEKDDTKPLSEYIALNRQLGRLIPEDTIWEILAQIMEVLHRDISSDHILWQEGGNVRLVKFRLATIQMLERRNGRSIPSTLAYTAPEILGGMDYSVVSDIWSVGCVLYELATLGKAFIALNQYQTISHIVKDGLFAAIPSAYSTTLKQVISFFLMQDPAQRPDTAQVLGLSQIWDARKRLVSMPRLEVDATQQLLMMSFSMLEKQALKMAELEEGELERARAHNGALEAAKQGELALAALSKEQGVKISELEKNLKEKETELMKIAQLKKELKDKDIKFENYRANIIRSHGELQKVITQGGPSQRVSDIGGQSGEEMEMEEEIDDEDIQLSDDESERDDDPDR